MALLVLRLFPWKGRRNTMLLHSPSRIQALWSMKVQKHPAPRPEPEQIPLRSSKLALGGRLFSQLVVLPPGWEALPLRRHKQAEFTRVGFEIFLHFHRQRAIGYADQIWTMFNILSPKSASSFINTQPVSVCKVPW